MIFEGIFSTILKLLSKAVIGRELRKIEKDPSLSATLKDLKQETDAYRAHIRKFCKEYPESKLCSESYNQRFLKDE